MDSTKKTNCVIILGMHRSGTSCLAGALQQAGLYLGNVSEHNKFNKKGNREHEDIMKLNDALLSYNNASWNHPPSEPILWAQQHIDSAKNIISTLKNNTKTGFWGFKDPRTLLTLTFWESILDEPRYVGTFRHPLNVLQSLQNRSTHKLNIEQTLELWNNYNQCLLNLNTPLSILSFDISSREYTEKVHEISQILKLPKTKKIDFFDMNLRTKHIHQQLKNELPPHIVTTYEKLNFYAMLGSIDL